MKIYSNLRVLSLAVVMAASGASAQEVSLPQLPANLQQADKLTTEQIKISHNNGHFWNRLIGGLQSNLFRGRAVNFSAFNLDLITFIHFNRSALPKNPNPYTFTMASDGNQIINGVPMWPIQGFVKSYTDEVYKIDGVETNLLPQENVYYLIESPQGHRERLERWEKALKNDKRYQNYIRESNLKDENNVYFRASGRIIGVVNSVGIDRLEVDFYQLVPGTNELVRAGVYSGNPAKSHNRY